MSTQKEIIDLLRMWKKEVRTLKVMASQKGITKTRLEKIAARRSAINHCIKDLRQLIKE